MLGALAGSGCSLLPRTSRVPMPLIHAPGSCLGTASPTLVVMLPGAYSRPEEFVDEGYVQALHESNPGVDAVIADAHLGYYRDRSVLARLRQDVILPARARGVQRVWLVGISLGGFGALGYGVRHPDEVDGIVAIAPYLGPDKLLRQIEAAGGPQAWRPTARPSEADDLPFEIWQALTAEPPALPPVDLGYGVDDRLAPGHRLLAQALGPTRVHRVPGGHDWPPWLALWRQWLGRGLLPRDCRGALARARGAAGVDEATAGHEGLAA